MVKAALNYEVSPHEQVQVVAKPAGVCSCCATKAFRSCCGTATCVYLLLNVWLTIFAYDGMTSLWSHERCEYGANGGPGDIIVVDELPTKIAFGSCAKQSRYALLRFTDTHRHSLTRTDTRRHSLKCTYTHWQAHTLYFAWYGHSQTLTDTRRHKHSQSLTDTHRHSQTLIDTHRHSQTLTNTHRNSQTLCISLSTHNLWTEQSSTGFEGGSWYGARCVPVPGW